MVDVNCSIVDRINTNFSYKYPFENDKDYQNCFLLTFGIEEYDELIIKKKIMQLLEAFKNNDSFIELINNLAKKMMSEDIEIGLFMLFSFDHIHSFIMAIKTNNFRDFYTNVK